jgi:hypothetical protein
MTIKWPEEGRQKAKIAGAGRDFFKEILLTARSPSTTVLLTHLATKIQTKKAKSLNL